MKWEPEELEQLGAIVARQLAPLLGGASEPNPCLTLAATATRMGLSETTVRKLVKAGKLKTVPGLTEKRVKQSTADNYGK